MSKEDEIGAVITAALVVLFAVIFIGSYLSYTVIEPVNMRTDASFAAEHKQDVGFCRYQEEEITVSRTWRESTETKTIYHMETASGDTWILEPDEWEQLTAGKTYQVGIVTCTCNCAEKSYGPKFTSIELKENNQ